MAETEEQASSVLNRIFRFISLGKWNNKSPPDAKFVEQFVLLRTALLQKITMICNRLGIEESTAIILLVHYQWNQDALFADWEAMPNLLPVVQKCAEVIESHEVSGAFCCNCQLPQRCRLINCGHLVCSACINGVDMVLLHKKKVLGCVGAMTLFSLGLKYKAWEQDNPWKAYFVKVGILFKLNKKVPMPWES